MPVAHPPPVTPAPVSVAQVQRTAKAVRYRFGAHTLHLFAFEELDRDAVDRLMREAPTAEHAVLGLSQLAYHSGYLTSQVLYAVDGNQVYVMLVQRRLRTVRGEPDLKRFFSSAVDDGRIDQASFERGRVLASAYSDRAQMDVRPHFVHAPGGSVDLDLRAQPDDSANMFSASMELNNHGSRFAGRNLIALGLTGNSSGGSQGLLRVKAAPSAINDTETIGEYLEGELQFSTVSPAGVTGLTGRRINFSAGDGNDELTGWYQEYGLEWSDVLAASAATRTMVRVRAAYSDRQSERAVDSAPLFGERYALAEITPTYAASFGFGRFDAALGIIGGWALDQYASAAAERFQLLRPMLRVRWQQTANLALTLTGAGQWASDVVAEAQQWTLGGNGSLSAYVPAALVGDRGTLARLSEGVKWDRASGWTLSGELFVEHGTAERFGVGGGSSTRLSGSDAGIALGAGWRRLFQVDVSMAQPIGGPKFSADARADFYGTFKLSF